MLLLDAAFLDVPAAEQLRDAAIDHQADTRGADRILLHDHVADAGRSWNKASDLDMRVLIETIAPHDHRLHHRRPAGSGRGLISANQNGRLVREDRPLGAGAIDVSLEDVIVEDLDPPAGLEMPIGLADRRKAAGP